MKTPKMYRQGDVLLIEISQFEEGYTPSKSKTVALGEATGHHHTFEGDVEILVSKETSNLAVNDQGILVDVRSDAILVHQEHATIEIPTGHYRRIIQREYSPEAVVNVMD